MTHTNERAYGMFCAFNDSERILLALQLLARVSSDRDSLIPAIGLSATTPFSSTSTQAFATPIERLMVASRAAHQFLQNSDTHPSLLRLQILLCYITMHLTVEYAIVPELQRNNPTWGKRKIEKEKYTQFQRFLTGAGNDVVVNVPAKLRVDVSFGKTYWALLGELGVAALMMLAVAPQGLTAFARVVGPGSDQRKALISALSSSRGWWLFAHAIGPAVLRTVFGPCDIEYTVPQPLRKLRIEPLPTASILAINKLSQTQNLAIDTEIANDDSPLEWRLDFGERKLPIVRHPNTIPDQRLESRNVWEWLGRDTRSKVIFEFLLPSGGGDADEVINIFCDLYNRRAIPGRKAVQFADLANLSEPGTQSLTDYDLIVLSAPANDLFLGVALNPAKMTITIYNWTENTDLQEQAGEVGSPV